MYKYYWSFYWPLALTTSLMVLGMQVFNGILARYPNAEYELAVMAYALSTVLFLEIATVFMPQMVTVYARSKQARRKVLIFCVGLGVLFSIPVLLLAVTSGGQRFLSAVFQIKGDMLSYVASYLLYLTPLIVVRSVYQFCVGLLTQINRTKWVSVSAFFGVAIGVVAALIGFNNGWTAQQSMVAAQVGATFCSAVFAMLMCKLLYRSEATTDFVEPGYRTLFNFFWPVSLSGMSFGISRPLLYAFMSRTPDAIVTIAALRVAFDFFMMIQLAINQFRSLFPGLGLDNLDKKRRFIALVSGGLVLLMFVSILTPLDRVIFHHMLGLDGRLFDMATQAAMVMLGTPIILAIRNYYHSLLLAFKRTNSMALGSATRVGLIAACSWLFLELGWLNHWTAPLVMIISFSSELLVSWLAVRRIRAETSL